MYRIFLKNLPFVRSIYQYVLCNPRMNIINQLILVMEDNFFLRGTKWHNITQIDLDLRI